MLFSHISADLPLNIILSVLNSNKLSGSILVKLLHIFSIFLLIS